MGSPFGPTFANISISDTERKHMDNLHKLGLNTWLRFVDDTCVTIGNIDQVKTILDTETVCMIRSNLLLKKNQTID